MKYRMIVALVIAVIAPVATADLYRDALSAFNSGHLDVARQLVRQLPSDHPERGELLQSIDSAATEARTPRQVDLTVAELEQGEEGKVFRSLDDPQLMTDLFAELDKSSDIYAAESQQHNELFGSETITASQQIAKLKLKMNEETDPAAFVESDSMAAAAEIATGADEPAHIPVVSNATPPAQCLSTEQIKEYFSKARNDAAAFAMDKARAIAKANEIRQQRAVARMRLEITAEITRKVRQELDARFDKEVAARVAALEAGKRAQQREQLARPGSGEAELLLAKQLADQSSEESRTWLELAAQKGNATAQFMLGERYFQPTSGEPDYDSAAMWWQRALSGGHADAAAALSLLRQRESPGS
ncbi:MAG: hypothetical protein P1U54_03490 [Immundisolibacteraceae bacterium]|nr:hypothetical protein [Immundisolibacteraceae bacterium]